MSYLGNEILKLRKKQGLSQEEFAEQIGVSRQMVSKWELGEAIPRASKVKLICEKFNISADQLFGSKESIGKNESHPVAFKRLKIALKGIAIISLIIILFYISYSIYKLILLNYIDNKIKKYEEWNNYHAEITRFEDGKETSKIEIWYKDNKYKVIINNSQNDEIDVIKETKYIDCNEKTIIQFERANDEKIVNNDSNIFKIYENGKYVQTFFPWINDICNNKIKKAFGLNIISISNNKENNNKVIKNNKNILTLNEDYSIPISYNDSTLGTIKFIYYDIDLNNVQDEDIEIKRDL